MRLLSRIIFREIFVSSVLGAVLFTFVVFLQRAPGMFKLLVGTSGSPGTVAYLFALVLPQILPLTIPFGVLVGTLITLSRMSTDGEITAMRAAGVPGRRVVPAILGFAFLATMVAAASSLWLTPWSIREFYRVENQLSAHQLTADIQPRVFEEQFPNTILYVSDINHGPDVAAGDGFSWRISRRRKSASRARPIVAIRRGSRSPRTPWQWPTSPTIGFNFMLGNGESYETDKDVQLSHLRRAHRRSGAGGAEERGASLAAVDGDGHSAAVSRRRITSQASIGSNCSMTRIELHRRLAVPLACMLLALAGIPLGITSRRAGKSSAVVLTVVIAFIYWIGLVELRQHGAAGTLTPEIAVWIPDVGVLRIRRRDDRAAGNPGRPRFRRHGHRPVPVRSDERRSSMGRACSTASGRESGPRGFLCCRR